jgi:hypothetical protein
VRKLICAILLAGLVSGCATSRTWEQPEDRVLQQQVKVGDRVSIVATNGSTYSFVVSSVGPDAVHGRNGRKSYKIAFAMIDSIHVERQHAWPGIVFVASVVAVGAVVALIDNAESQNWDFCGGN